jgi:hypothetical protein
MEAGGDGDGLTAKVAQPKLTANGVEITIALVENQSLKPGDEPAFELRLVNTTNQPAAAAVRVAMSSMSLGPSVSRIGPIAQEFWQDRYTMTLKPSETKVVAIATKTKLPANSTINVVLQSVDPSTATAAPVAYGFSKTYVQTAKPNLVSVPPNAPKVQADQRFGLDPSAIMALSFSTVTATAQPGLVAAK